MDITQELANCCNKLKSNQLPVEVIDRVKYFFLDFIGVASRETQEKSSKSVYQFFREMDCGRRGGLIIGTRETASFNYSALTIGVSSHAIEMNSRQKGDIRAERA